jgi:aspartyl/asparaginyl-tRNA synthetase
MKVQGRVVLVEKSRLFLQTEKEVRQIEGIDPSSIQVGDIIEVSLLENSARVLTPNRSPQRTYHWLRRTLDPRRLRGIEIRSQVESGIHDFFKSRGFRHVRTPLLVPCPGMEPHIRPFRVQSSANPDALHFLPTSPEFAMKRLLVGGLEKIFQICPAFRDEPHSVTHLPEFTLLEWYRAYAGYE